MRRRIVSLLLFCLFLCGCGNSAKENNIGSSPFTESERAAFETQLLDSMSFSTGGDMNFIPVYFCNNSDHDIADLRFTGEVFTDISVLYYSLIPAHTTVYAAMYTSDEQRSSGQCYTLKYKIGGYEYWSKGIDLDYYIRNQVGNDDPLSFRIFLQTDGGEIPLDPRAPISFVTGTELEGLKTGRIYSINPELFNYEKHILNLGLNIGGMLPPDGAALIAKLADENGNIRDIASVRNDSGMIKLNLGGNVEPGKYYLRFEELG